ncbi:MAG: ATP-binding protein, partial [Sulfurifustaceae bacterium]
MAIHAYDPNDKDAFGEKLGTVLSPSQPIDSIEHLFGRAVELDRIRKALYAPGRHIVIYGDRGVGKSSLAATAAVQYQSSDNSPLFIGCGPDATFGSVIANIAYEAAKVSRIHSVTNSTTTGVAWQYFSIKSGKTEAARDLRSEIRT